MKISIICGLIALTEISLHADVFSPAAENGPPSNSQRRTAAARHLSLNEKAKQTPSKEKPNKKKHRQNKKKHRHKVQASTHGTSPTSSGTSGTSATTAAAIAAPPSPSMADLIAMGGTGAPAGPPGINNGVVTNRYLVNNVSFTMSGTPTASSFTSTGTAGSVSLSSTTTISGSKTKQVATYKLSNVTGTSGPALMTATVKGVVITITVNGGTTTYNLQTGLLTQPNGNTVNYSPLAPPSVDFLPGGVKLLPYPPGSSTLPEVVLPDGTIAAAGAVTFP